MRIDPEDVRRHYASLSDEALGEIDRAELSDLAKPIYDEELARRGVAAAPEDEIENEPAPDWLEDAACACAFTLRTATYNVPTAVKARAALHSAGIPCHVTMSQDDPPKVDPAPQYSLRLMVPGARALHATSVLDEDIFNEDQEAEFRTNLEMLSDDELQELNPDVLCAGLLDRVARLKRAYADEIARRGLE